MKRSIHNNYNLTERQLQRFIEIFPYTRGAELQIKFALTLNEISKLRQKYNLKKDAKVFVLEPSKIEKLRREFYGYKNYELTEKFGISRSQLDYIRKNLGLQKREFRKC